MAERFDIFPLVGVRGRGQFFLVSRIDAPRVELHKWYLGKAGYPIANVRSDGKAGTVKLHLYLFGRRPGFEIDHFNRDHLDNRRSNLFWVTHAENMQNTAMRQTNRSGYRGVRWHPKCRLFQARATMNDRDYYLGYYRTAAEAGAAVERFWRAQTYHGLAVTKSHWLNPALNVTGGGR
jgi:hypothetical protein